MGSFPNKVASQILKALFIDKDKVSVPGFYSNAKSEKGIYTDKSNNVVSLYVGLIAGGTTTNSLPDGTGSLASVLTDSSIVSSGNISWPVQAGLKGLYEFTGNNNNTSRQVAEFELVYTTTEDSSSAVATIQGPLQPITFAGNGGVSNSQPTHQSVIGFFVTTLETLKGVAAGTSNAPTIVAYGTLSASRNIQQGDNPTFSQNSITITLE
jgi:hypothetical protein